MVVDNEEFSLEVIEETVYNLSDKMKETLLDIGYGVSGRIDGFYNEDNERINMKSVGALSRRNLVAGGHSGSRTGAGSLWLTDKGWGVFYEVQKEMQD